MWRCLQLNVFGFPLRAPESRIHDIVYILHVAPHELYRGFSTQVAVQRAREEVDESNLTRPRSAVEFGSRC